MQDIRNNDFIVQYKNMSQQCFSKHDKVVPFNNRIYLPRQTLVKIHWTQYIVHVPADKLIILEPVQYKL